MDPETTPPSVATPQLQPQPPIFTLSTDLIVHLARELDEDDLLALRTTCKELNYKAREVHLGSLYHTRSVFFVPASLENLLKVATHISGVNSRVRHIRICPASPYINPERDVRKKLEEQAKNEIPGEEGPMPAGLVLKMYEQSKNEWPEVKYMQTWDLAANMLAVAFSNLPNIQTIQFDWKKAHSMTRSEFNLLYPSVGLLPGKRLPADLVNAISTYVIPLDYKHSGYWNIVTNAALIAGLSKLEKISDIGLFGDGVPLSWFIMPQSRLTKMGTAFSSLRILHLTFSDGERRNRAGIINPRPTGTMSRQTLCKWVESVGSSIEELRLEDMTSSARYEDGSPLPVLRKLKLLELVGLALKAESFKEAIEASQSSLNDIMFSQCLLENPKAEWVEILRDIKAKCQKLTKLNVVMKGQWRRREERFPDIDYRGEDLNSEKSFCLITPGVQERSEFFHRSVHTLQKNLGNLLDQHKEPEQFWDALTDRKWRQWPESSQRRNLRINRQFTFDDDEEGGPVALSPPSPGSDNSW
ncbi:hypothetical protein TWF694_004443 [Orbilia ellipsospora]|uniref:F-box domain-containing protein n=1 Tax=Orbilia ellipsospora TaxID=2528407 RepID=A0AAV9WVF3_9PEZI